MASAKAQELARRSAALPSHMRRRRQVQPARRRPRSGQTALVPHPVLAQAHPAVLPAAVAHTASASLTMPKLNLSLSLSLAAAPRLVVGHWLWAVAAAARVRVRVRARMVRGWARKFGSMAMLMT